MVLRAEVVNKQSKRKIEREIMQASGLALNLRISKNQIRIEKRMREVVAKAIRATPEYDELIGGVLQSELGVVAPRPKLKEIIDTWIKGIKINVDKLRFDGQNLIGNISIGTKADYTDILGLPAATYVTEKGVTIEWLRWLLLEGDQIIVINYVVGPDPNKLARTKLGQIMYRYGTKYAGYHVPPEYSGTASDNFITRALENAQPEMIKLVEGLFR